MGIMRLYELLTINQQRIPSNNCSTQAAYINHTTMGVLTRVLLNIISSQKSQSILSCNTQNTDFILTQKHAQ